MTKFAPAVLADSEKSYHHKMSLRGRGMRIGVIPMAFAVLSSGACLTAHSASRPGSDRNLITREQIADSRFQTAYEAVEALHSNWLQTRGTDSFQNPSEVKVYLDNTMLGGTSTLRDITTRTVSWIRFYDGVAAQGRWGVGHSAGVIFVSTHTASIDPPGSGPGTR